MFLRNFGTFWKCSQTGLRSGAALLVAESFPRRHSGCRVAVAVAVLAWLPTPLAGQPAVGIDAAAKQRWFVIQSASGKIGHAVQRKRQIGDQLRWSQQMQLRLNRFGDVVTQKVNLISVEDQFGRVLRFESVINDGQQEQRIAGVRLDDRLDVTSSVGPDRHTSKIEHPGDCGGFFAMERSLETQPMKVGEHREIRSVVPLVTKVATTSLVAKAREPTDLRSETKQLLRIEGAVEFDQQTKIAFIVWTDDAGVVIKNHVPSIGQTTYLSTEAEATSTENIATFDLNSLANVPVTKLTGDPHAAEYAVYRVRSQATEVALADLIPMGGGQRVTKQPGGAIDVRVRRVRPNLQLTAAQPTKTDGYVPDDLAANLFIDNDDPVVVALSRRVSEDHGERWQIALELERLVFETITDKSYARTFDSASTAARTRVGDCTEHAVLLAALCRAHGIPARFVAGLVHLQGQEAFGMHAWTEVWIGDRWLGLDATMARGGLGAGHIKICNSNLAEANPAAATLPVAQLLGKDLTIECLELHHD